MRLRLPTSGWIVLAATVVAGCGGSSGLDGTYHDDKGLFTLEVKAGEASISAGGTEEFTGRVVGNTVVLYEAGDTTDSLVFTRNGDGTLSSAIGTFSKRE